MCHEFFLFFSFFFIFFYFFLFFLFCAHLMKSYISLFIFTCISLLPICHVLIFNSHNNIHFFLFCFLLFFSHGLLYFVFSKNIMIFPSFFLFPFSFSFLLLFFSFFFQFRLQQRHRITFNKHVNKRTRVSKITHGCGTKELNVGRKKKRKEVSSNNDSYTYTQTLSYTVCWTRETFKKIYLNLKT